MSDSISLDVRIDSRDVADVTGIAQHLSVLSPRPLDEHRDFGTVLTLTAAAIPVIKALVDLWKDLKAKPSAPKVEIETASGETLVLADATPETIEAFVRQGTQPGRDATADLPHRYKRGQKARKT